MATVDVTLPLALVALQYNDVPFIVSVKLSSWDDAAVSPGFL